MSWSLRGLDIWREQLGRCGPAGRHDGRWRLGTRTRKWQRMGTSRYKRCRLGNKCSSTDTRTTVITTAATTTTTTTGSTSSSVSATEGSERQELGALQAAAAAACAAATTPTSASTECQYASNGSNCLESPRRHEQNRLEHSQEP